MKYKTVTVKATTETNLYLTVNVPKEWDDNRIYRWACDANGADFMEDGNDDWYIVPDIIHEEYDPDVVTAKEKHSA